MRSYRKKLIEVALPMDDINKACSHEKMPGIGPHPRGLHLWWARRPLSAARAVIFAQMVDDPSSLPELSEDDVLRERERLFDIIRELVKWENTANEEVLEKARAEIRKSWSRTCIETGEDPNQIPAFHDPFAGGGAIPLEAQRLGLEVYASDLNPVAVLINKAMIEVPPKFAGQAPVNPEICKQKALFGKTWKGAEGLSEDVHYYGEWMRDEAKKQIGHLYPKVKVDDKMAMGREDLKPYVGKELNVIAWIWARTVKSPNPVFSHVDVPLISTYMLSNKKGVEVYIEPVVEGDRYEFSVITGKPADIVAAKIGTKMSRGSFRCLLSNVPIRYEYINDEANAGRMMVKLMAIVAGGNRERLYLSPNMQHELAARKANPKWKPDTPTWGTGGSNAIGRRYGFHVFGDYFTSRQLVGLTTLSELVVEVQKRVKKDALSKGLNDDDKPLRDGGTGAMAYAEAIGIYLAFAVDRVVDFSNSCTRWVPGNQKVMKTFARQVIPMTWDFPEAAILNQTVGGFGPASNFISKCINKLPYSGYGIATQQNAITSTISTGKIISTDPPYYDNIGYADLSDFFYVWLRRSMKSLFPQLFATVAVPKTEELVATPYRHGGKKKTEAFFLDGMSKVMTRLSEQAHPAFPVTIYYAFKQSEKKDIRGTASTGWETFLSAVLSAGFGITGTWPMRSEQEYRMKGMGANALASSLVLVCRRRDVKAPATTHRDFIRALHTELPKALSYLQRSNIAPVDLAQSAIGPGMAIFSRYSKVIEADGHPMTVLSALQLINRSLDEILSEEEGLIDADTSFAVTWFETYQYSDGPFGEAETLAKARAVAVSGVQEAGILKSAAGKVRLITRDELRDDWDPDTDRRLTVWGATQYLIKRLEGEGEEAAAALLKKLGVTADQARNLAYRLFNICERKKWPEEARAYNGLVIAWPELEKLAGNKPATSVSLIQTDMFE